MDNLELLFASQRKAQDLNPYPSVKLRVDRINRLIDLLITNKQQLCLAVENDFGQRCHELTTAFDILAPVHSLKYAKKNIDRWVRPKRHKANFPFNILGSKAYVKPVPLGLVGNISPWNFPITLALSPMGGILAAGNRVMIKPSEFTPETSELLKTLISDYFSQEEIAVVTGDVEVAARFAQLRFDHLLFTGSTSVARKVASACAPNLVPATLELGGKSPVIVGESANLLDVAEKVIAAKTLNAGQICLAPDYLLIHRSKVEDLISAMAQCAEKLFPQGINSPDYANLIQVRHVERLTAHLRDAEHNGNQVVPLFKSFKNQTTDDPRRLAPHAIVVNNLSTSIMQEELFGPLLPIVPIDDFSDVLPIVQARRNPLAVYYFGHNPQELQIVEEQIPSGGLVINELLLHFTQDDLPFGGVGESGMGAYHGARGFQQFSHEKAVFTAPKYNVGKLLRPPYGERFRKLVNAQLKR